MVNLTDKNNQIVQIVSYRVAFHVSVELFSVAGSPHLRKDGSPSRRPTNSSMAEF